MPDTTVRVEYIGAVQNFSEVTITGNQQVWRIGSSAFVETGRASQLVASGKFRSLANDPAMLPANQAKVGASPSAQGVDLLDPRDGSVLTPEDLGWDVGGGGGASVVVRAKSFPGVDSTGATDCTDVLNAALAALAPGSVVYFEPGTYVAAVRLLVPNTTLTGTWAATIKTPSGATSHVNDACVRILADGCVVENLTLDGNKTGNPQIDDSTLGRQSDGVGIYANRVTVRGCRVFNTIGHKIIVWNQGFTPTNTAKGARAYFTIEGNHVTGFSWRASIDVASTDVTAPVNNNGIIRGNFVDGNMMVVHTGYDLLFHGNVILNSGAEGEGGISVHTNSKRVTCSNNIIGPGGFGLATSNNCESVAFSNNKIYNTTGAAIVLSYGTDLSADGNLIQTTGADSAGVQLISAAGATVRNNTIIGSGDRSVYVTTASSSVQISDNKSVNPTKYHVEIAGASDVIIANNKCNGGTTGMVITSGTNADVVLDGNSLTNTSSSAISINTAAAIIINNIIKTSGSHAIRVSGQDSRVSGNDINGATGNGINILAAVTGISLTENRIRNTSNTAITGLQPDTVVRRNVGYVTESRGSATIADGSSTLVVTHGLATTPNSVVVTPRTNEAVWVSSRASANFTLSRAGTSGALIVDWQAEI